MCTRYSLAAEAPQIKKYFNVDVPVRYEALYNAAPADVLPVITQESPEGLSYFYWGIPPEWAKKKAVSNKLINAPLEQLAAKSSYRNALKNRRCIVPADGFYAWKALGKKTKIPYRFLRHDKEIFAFAGIWEEFESETDGEPYHTFMIITCPANETVSVVDDNMPVILSPENEKKWLDENLSIDELMEFITPYPDDKLYSYTVSNRIDTSGENSPFLIKPSAPIDQHGNYSLFD